MMNRISISEPGGKGATSWRLGADLLGIALAGLFAGACVAGEPLQAGPKFGDVAEFNPDLQAAECPPPSYSWTNYDQNNAAALLFTCSGNSGGNTTLPPGSSVTFKARCGDQDESCIPCGLIGLWVNGSKVFSCEVQAVYFAAYGIDLAEVESPIVPEPRYDQHGNPRPRWAVPLVGENNKSVGWEFTEIEPEFFIENDEIVIRSKNRHSSIGGDRVIEKGQVIGNAREGIAPGNHAE